jgi:thiol-disulfide isomerase/thioredoxin
MRLGSAFVLAATAAFATLAFAQSTPPAKEAPAKETPAKDFPLPKTPAAPKAAPAATGGDQVDEKAKAIYDRSVDAAKKLKSVSYVCEFDGKGNPMDPAAQLKGATRVELEFGPGEDKPFNLARIETGKDSQQRIYTYDGTKAVLVDSPAKNYVESTDSWVAIIAPLMPALPDWILMHRLMPAEQMSMLKLVSLTSKGEETIDGTPCDLLEVVREVDTQMDSESPGGAKMRMTEKIAIARSDSMPRRLSQHMKMMGPQTMEMDRPAATYTEVKVDPKLDPANFAAKIPQSYAKKELPKEDFGEMPELAFKAGDKAPEFKLTGTDGKEVSLASLAGKVVLLDFWATWCGPCKAAMPDMQQISEDYADKGVVVLGINTWERQEGAAKKYMADKKFTYPCLLSGDELATKYGLSGIPTLVVIGKDGKIELIESGAPPKGAKKLRETIDAAIAKKA